VTYITLQIFLCPLPTLEVNAIESKYFGDNFIKIIIHFIQEFNMLLVLIVFSIAAILENMLYKTIFQIKIVTISY